MTTEAEAAVEPQSTEAETQENQEQQRDDAAPSSTEPQQPAKKEDDPASKALAATQRRINRLTAEKYQERAAREQIERELQQLRAQSGEQPQHEPQAPFTREQVEREAKALMEQQRFNEQCNALAAQGRKAAPDFDARLATLASVTGPLFNDRGRPEPLLQAVLATDAPAKVMLHLAAHPDIAAELVDLTPLQQARRLGRIETELTAPRQTSSAPRPLEPVKAGAASSAEPDPADTARWIAWRNKQEREQRANR